MVWYDPYILLRTGRISVLGRCSIYCMVLWEESCAPFL